MRNESDNGPNKQALVDALAGVLANVITVWALYPVDLYKTRLQVGSHPNNTKNLDKHEPVDRILSHYDGIGMKTLHSAASSFSYFYLYSWIEFRYTTMRGGSQESLSPHIRLFLTGLAAMGNTIVTLPLDVLASRHQAQACNIDLQDNKMVLQLDDDISDDNCFKQNSDCGLPLSSSALSVLLIRHLRSILRIVQKRLHYVRQLWRGLWPALILCTNPAINYTVFDAVKVRYVSRHGRTNLMWHEAFLLGVIAKLVSTFATYPLIVAKSKLMATNRSKTLIRCLCDDCRIGTLYRGFDVQVCHTVLKSAIMMMLKEKIAAIAQNVAFQ